MSRLSTYLKTQVRRLVMARVGRRAASTSRSSTGSPTSLSWPLQRNGVDPVERLGELRAPRAGRQADVVPRA